MAYTNAEEVELFLNGRSLGRKKKGEPYVIPVGKKVSEDLRFTTKYRHRVGGPLRARAR